MKERKATYLKVQEGFGNMEIIKIYADQSIAQYSDAIACIGYFDGIHLGHQKLIEKVITLAKENNCVPSCICFDNDPWIILNKTSDKTQLTPLTKRLEILQSFGIKRTYLLHFDENMMKMYAHTFVSEILNKMSLKGLVCGDDFHFAYKGEGNVETLKQGNFTLYIVDHVMYDNIKISSSIIEKHIKEGNIALANDQLGYVYSMDGYVVHGNKIGNNKLGFPTANISVKDVYVIPKQGVYSGEVKIDNKFYKAMINIGFNPTINLVDHISIEAHIIDFNKQIYDSPISVYFKKYLRKERKFASKEALIEQLNKDIEIVRKER